MSELIAKVNDYIDTIKDRPNLGYSWPITITVPVMRTVVTVTIIAKRLRKDNRGRGNSMRSKKRALRHYK